MKLYKPLFSIIVIIIQLILSVKSYYEYVGWGKANAELDGLITRHFLDDSLFLFVLVIGFYEMITKPILFKKILRILLVSIIFGTQFSGFIPINNFYFGVYNSAWFVAGITFVLILVRLGKYVFEKIKERNSDRTQKVSK